LDQVVLEPEPKYLDAWSRSSKFEFRLHSHAIAAGHLLHISRVHAMQV